LGNVEEVVRELREMGFGIVAVEIFERFADRAMELDPSARVKVCVERLPHQNVREAVAPERS
jgi:hypothetical protein